jgi:hypothetical protein
MELSDLHLLQTVPAYHVQAILRARLITLFADRQNPEATAQNLEEVAELLFEQRACRAALRKLGASEARVLRELVACGGRANSRDLALYLSLVDAPLVTHTRAHDRSEDLAAYSSTSSSPRRAQTGATLYPAPHPHGAFEQALHRLLLLGLLFWGKQTNFGGQDYSSGVYDGVLIVPQTVVQLANQEWQLAKEAETHAEEQPNEGIYTLQRALYLYWSLVASVRDGLPLVNNRLLSRTALRQVLDNLAGLSRFWQDLASEQIHTESDIPFLLFLRLLLMKLGLLVERRGALHAASAHAFFSLPLVERAWRCFHLWLETPFWNELASIPNVIAQPGPAPLEAAHEEVVRSRQMVVKHVLQLIPQTWYAFPAFVARMKLYVTYLLFPRQYGLRAERYSVGSNPYGWNFRLRRGWLTHREGWHMVEGGFIRALAGGPLFWLGVVELDAAEHADAFRLAPGAGLLSGQAPPVLPELAWGRLVVQPNFDLVALAPVSEALLVSLDRFAERVRLEHIAQYRLSKASVIRAIQLGLTAAVIQEILEQAAGSALPQNVQYSLIEWERQARRVELWRNAVLFEVDDPALLDELYADQVTCTWLLRRLAPALAEVSSEHLVELQELLWQRGYLPIASAATLHQNLLTDANLPRHEPQWSLASDGLLKPCYPLAHLYLATELERFTELDATSGWRRITPGSLQRALEADFGLDGIIRFLQQYCAGGIPGSLLIRLKLWGSGYASPPDLCVEPAPLLSLSPQALSDILADEEIGPLLAEPVPEEKRLVRVPQEHLQRVVELLRARGFEV